MGYFAFASPSSASTRTSAAMRSIRSNVTCEKQLTTVAGKSGTGEKSISGLMTAWRDASKSVKSMVIPSCRRLPSIIADFAAKGNRRAAVYTISK